MFFCALPVSFLLRYPNLFWVRFGVMSQGMACFKLFRALSVSLFFWVVCVFFSAPSVSFCFVSYGCL